MKKQGALILSVKTALIVAVGFIGLVVAMPETEASKQTSKSVSYERGYKIIVSHTVNAEGQIITTIKRIGGSK